MEDGAPIVLSFVILALWIAFVMTDGIVLLGMALAATVLQIILLLAQSPYKIIRTR